MIEAAMGAGAPGGFLRGTFALSWAGSLWLAGRVWFLVDLSGLDPELPPFYMNGIKEELTRGWLIKANRDLLSARQLAEGELPLLDTAAYHCQQAAEKAIKGFLLYHDIRFDPRRSAMRSIRCDLRTGF
jgi:hypothetical protein